MSSVQSIQLDYARDYDVVGLPRADGGKLPTLEEWVRKVQEHLTLYLRSFRKDGKGADRCAASREIWGDIIYDPPKKDNYFWELLKQWEETDLRCKFVKFCELYPIAGGCGYSKTKELYLRGGSEIISDRVWLKAAMHDYIYKFELFPRRTTTN